MAKQRFTQPVTTGSSTYLEEKQVKITLQTRMAGPNGVAQPGTVLDLPTEEAKKMVEGRFARDYDPARDAKAKVGLSKPPENWER